jgi:hypothetical protein
MSLQHRRKKLYYLLLLHPACIVRIFAEFSE